MTTTGLASETLELGAQPPSSTTSFLLNVELGLPSPAQLPVLAVRGRHPGPTALLVSGVHGDEFEGIAALPQLVRGLDPEVVHGTVLALPVCNPYAFAAKSRCTPEALDGANLARVFPGDRGGGPTHRLAAVLFALATKVLTPDGLFVDLHSAGTRYRYLPLAGFRDIPGPARAASEEAARHVGVGRLWRIWDQRGMFNAEMTRVGIPTVGLEAPGQGGCHDDDVAAYVTGLRNLLAWRGLLETPAAPRDDSAPQCPTELTAAADGLFRIRRAAGDWVRHDDPIGLITDTFGETIATIRAPHDGQIWGIRTFGSIQAGDLAAWVCAPGSSPFPSGPQS